MELTVVTREPSPEIAKCELTCIGREPIDPARVAAQHAAYVRVFQLRLPRLRLIVLPALDKHPDCMFVEDVAVVVPECAVLTRPGVASRRGEVSHMEGTLSRLRPNAVRCIEAPGTIEGGDTLVVGRHVFVGSSTRTNEAGFKQLAAHLAPFGYDCVQLPVEGCMHLKCVATKLTEDTVLINPKLIAKDVFTQRGLNVVEIAADAEPMAANVLAFAVSPAERVVCVAHTYPQTNAIVRAWAAQQTPAVEVVELEVDEVAKAEGALTCCSLLAYAPPREEAG